MLEKNFCLKSPSRPNLSNNLKTFPYFDQSCKILWCCLGLCEVLCSHFPNKLCMHLLEATSHLHCTKSEMKVRTVEILKSNT